MLPCYSSVVSSGYFTTTDWLTECFDCGPTRSRPWWWGGAAGLSKTWQATASCRVRSSGSFLTWNYIKAFYAVKLRKTTVVVRTRKIYPNISFALNHWWCWQHRNEYQISSVDIRHSDMSQIANQFIALFLHSIKQTPFCSFCIWRSWRNFKLHTFFILLM